MENDYKEAARAASEAGRVKNAIAEAAALDTQEEQKTQKKVVAQKKQKAPENKPRKDDYDEKEIEEFIKEKRTRGRKGVKVPCIRVNQALPPELHEYIKIMARARGESMTDFINYVIEKHKEEHEELYKHIKTIFV